MVLAGRGECVHANGWSGLPVGGRQVDGRCPLVPREPTLTNRGPCCCGPCCGVVGDWQSKPDDAVDGARGNVREFVQERQYGGRVGADGAATSLVAEGVRGERDGYGSTVSGQAVDGMLGRDGVEKLGVFDRTHRDGVQLHDALVGGTTELGPTWFADVVHKTEDGERHVRLRGGGRDNGRPVRQPRGRDVCIQVYARDGKAGVGGVSKGSVDLRRNLAGRERLRGLGPTKRERIRAAPFCCWAPIRAGGANGLAVVGPKACPNVVFSSENDSFVDTRCLVDGQRHARRPHPLPDVYIVREGAWGRTRCRGCNDQDVSESRY